MNSLNLVGNMTKDIELTYSGNGNAIAKSGLAVNKKVQGVDKTMFIDITFFGKTAETANQYLHKGSKIAVSGELEFDQWVSQDGTKKSKHAMSVSRMTMLDSAPQNGGQQQNNGGGQGYGNQQQNNGQNGSYQAPQQQNNGQQNQNQGQQQNNGGGQQNGNQQQNQNNGQQNINYGNQGQQNGGNMPQFDNNGGGQGNNQ